MAKTLPFVLVLALWGGGALAGVSQQITLEDFQSFSPGQTPSEGWRDRNGDPKKVYRVELEEGGQKVLHALDHGESVQFYKEVKWDLKKYPYLKWRWRVKQFPEGADERKRETNDSAAAVYVVFPRFILPDSLKYAFSGTVPDHTWIAHSASHPMLILRSGKTKIGEWFSEVRNVAEDYQSQFHKPPPNPVAIGFLTDANSVKKTAEADYDDLVISSTP